MTDFNKNTDQELTTEDLGQMAGGVPTCPTTSWDSGDVISTLFTFGLYGGIREAVHNGENEQRVKLGLCKL